MVGFFRHGPTELLRSTLLGHALKCHRVHIVLLDQIQPIRHESNHASTNHIESLINIIVTSNSNPTVIQPTSNHRHQQLLAATVARPGCAQGSACRAQGVAQGCSEEGCGAQGDAGSEAEGAGSTTQTSWWLESSCGYAGNRGISKGGRWT